MEWLWTLENGLTDCTWPSAHSSGCAALENSPTSPKNCQGWEETEDYKKWGGACSSAALACFWGCERVFIFRYALSADVPTLPPPASLSPPGLTSTILTRKVHMPQSTRH